MLLAIQVAHKFSEVKTVVVCGYNLIATWMQGAARYGTAPGKVVLRAGCLFR